jgi:hypothetical protein
VGVPTPTPTATPIHTPTATPPCPTTTPTCPPCSPDDYEPDNTSSEAKEIFTDGTIQEHNFHVGGDKDWVKFNAAAGMIYVIKTSNLGTNCDTVLCLYDTDGTTLIECNDDYGSLASRIEWQAPSSGTYFAMVRHHNPTASCSNTNYDLSITESIPTPTPTATSTHTPTPTPTATATHTPTPTPTEKPGVELHYIYIPIMFKYWPFFPP